MALRLFRPNNPLFRSTPLRKAVFTTSNCTFWNRIFKKHLKHDITSRECEPYLAIANKKVIFVGELAPLVHLAKRIGGSAVILAAFECPFLLFNMNPAIPPIVQVGICATLFGMAYIPAFFFNSFFGRFVISMQLQFSEKGMIRKQKLDQDRKLIAFMVNNSISVGQFWSYSDEEYERLVEQAHKWADTTNASLKVDTEDWRKAMYGFKVGITQPIRTDLYCLELITHGIAGCRNYHHVKFDDFVFYLKQDEWPPIWREKSTGKLFYFEEQNLYQLPPWVFSIVNAANQEELKLLAAKRELEEAEEAALEAQRKKRKWRK